MLLQIVALSLSFALAQNKPSASPSPSAASTKPAAVSVQTPTKDPNQAQVPPLSDPSEPCNEFAKDFCPGTTQANGDTRKCLSTQMNKLSPACQFYLRLNDARKDARPRKCRKEAEKFCGYVKAGRDSMRECLKENKEKFSEACRRIDEEFVAKYIAEHAGEMKGLTPVRLPLVKNVEPVDPCFQMAREFCKNTKQADGTTRKCLEKNKDKLPPNCQNYLEFNEARMAATSPQCKEETKKFCGYVRAGINSMSKCLMDNKMKFSETCRRKDQDFTMKYEQSHMQGFKKIATPPKIPKSVPADPESVKPPPPIPPDPPPEGYTPPPPKKNTSAHPAQTPVPTGKPAPQGP